MTRSTALGLLNVCNNGNEILAILDVIVADIESEQTINDIADLLFDWYHERMAADLFVISAAIRYLTVFIKALPLIDARPILKCLTTLTYRGDKTREWFRVHKKNRREKN